MACRGTTCFLRKVSSVDTVSLWMINLMSKQWSETNVERSDWCLISRRLDLPTFTWSCCENPRSRYKCGADWHVMSLCVHRDAARPAWGADIEAGLPGGGDVKGKLYVQPSTTCCRYQVVCERQAGEYCSSWNWFFNVCASYRKCSWQFVQTEVANNLGWVCCLIDWSLKSCGMSS
jgi:hypothetical protein